MFTGNQHWSHCLWVRSVVFHSAVQYDFNLVLVSKLSTHFDIRVTYLNGISLSFLKRFILYMWVFAWMYIYAVSLEAKRGHQIY